MYLEIAVFAFAIYVLIALWASMKVISDEFSSRWQKAAQLMLVCVFL